MRVKLGQYDLWTFRLFKDLAESYPELVDVAENGYDLFSAIRSVIMTIYIQRGIHIDSV